jgi:hypothetical protein
MPSIENLYWILHSNLLKPSGLDTWYYYPFGTKDRLSQFQYSGRPECKQEHHVLYHFDQEPIWSDDLGVLYLSLLRTSPSKIVTILANSEHSAIKKKICRQYGMMDWYFFYHGFAALDWFADSRFIDTNIQPTKVFCSLNHLSRNFRAYRMSLVCRFLLKQLHPFGDISLHANQSDLQQEINCPSSLITDNDKKLMSQCAEMAKQWPLIVDKVEIDGTSSACFNHRTYALWQNSFVHVVNETVFYHSKLHLTEKVFKPIVALRPFVLAAAPGNLAYLRSYGFKTFDRWWDESYDSVADVDRRSDMIVNIIEKLCALSRKELDDLYQDMLPVLLFNKQHFFNEFRQTIVEELVNNFDTCLRIWNNGRVDGREVVLPQNLPLVKKILLR